MVARKQGVSGDWYGPNGAIYPKIGCYVNGCNENAPFQALARGASRQFCETHYNDHEREQRWIARGRPEGKHISVKDLVKKMRDFTQIPKMTNLERAHMILAQDAPNLIALEWAREYLLRHATQGEANANTE